MPVPPQTVPATWARLVDDAAMFPPGNAELDTAVAAHLRRRAQPHADVVGPLVARDTDLPRLEGADVELAVVVTGGAGQVGAAPALCQRRGMRLAALEVALRDPDELAGNARRLVAAVDAVRSDGALHPDAPVYVELPNQPVSASWLAAADEVAAAGLRLKFRTGGLEPEAFPSAADLATRIQAALDRETPFKCTAGLRHAVRHTVAAGSEGFGEPVDQHGFLNVLLATRAALDGAGPAEVEAVLERREAEALADEARRSDLAGARRWFTSFGSCSVDEPVSDLLALGLLPAPEREPA